MNLDGEIRRAVGFLIVTSGSGRQYAAATVFFVRDSGSSPPLIYAVTAQHVIRNVPAASKLFIRLRDDKGDVDVPTEQKHWFHLDGSDVSVARFNVAESSSRPYHCSTVLILSGQSKTTSTSGVRLFL